ncbi:MAG: IS1 family transposase [bacterium]
METVKCPRCKSNKSIKNGIVKNRQRYHCKDCGYNYTVSKLGKTIDKSYVVMALQLYLEGLGFRAIERFLGISNVTIMNWVRKYGSKFESIRLDEDETEVIEIDELYSYIQSKKNEFGFGLLSSGKTKKFWISRQGTEVNSMEIGYLEK